MSTERDYTEIRESAPTNATSEFAVQAWDKTQWTGNTASTGDAKLTQVDFGNNDIYNTGRGNRELGAGNRSLQTAENSINRTVDQLLDGNYNKKDLLKQLGDSDRELSEATDEYRGAIRHMGLSTRGDDLQDLVDGRRDVMGADKNVGKAIEQLKKGDEDGAIRSLLKSLGQIDEAQSEIKDGSTVDNPRRPPHGRDTDGGGDEDRNHGHGHGHGRGHGRGHDRDNERGEEDCDRDGKRTDDYRGGGRNYDRDDDRRMSDHMYRGDRSNSHNFNPLDPVGIFDGEFNPLDPAGVFNRDFNPLDPAGIFTRLNDSLHGNNGSNDYGRTDSGMWNSGGLNLSGLRIPGPLGGSLDLDQITNTADQLHRVADPLGLLPSPSELKDPKKVIKHVLDPFDIF